MKKTNTGGVAAEFAKKAGIVAKESTFKERTWVHTSRTLYVTNVAPGTQTDELEGLFRDLEGFIAFRRVRSMGFVDFQEKQQATVAMWKTNGHKFRPHHDGLLVSYDKDDSEERGGWSMRTREEEKRRRMEADATRVMYRCSACSHFCFKLARPITDMPERKTDKSRVVDTGKDLVYLVCVKGGTKLLKREKGIEKQFRYNCELCDICVAYRPVPYEQESKFIYVFPEAVVSSTSRSTANPPTATRHGRPGGTAAPSRPVEKIAIGDPTEGDGLLGPSPDTSSEPSLPAVDPGSVPEASSAPASETQRTGDGASIGASEQSGKRKAEESSLRPRQKESAEDRADAAGSRAEYRDADEQTGSAADRELHDTHSDLPAPPPPQSDQLLPLGAKLLDGVSGAPPVAPPENVEAGLGGDASGREQVGNTAESTPRPISLPTADEEGEKAGNDRAREEKLDGPASSQSGISEAMQKGLRGREGKEGGKAPS